MARRRFHHNTLPKADPAPYNKVGYRVYYEWLDEKDNKLVRATTVIDWLSSPEMAKKFVTEGGYHGDRHVSGHGKWKGFRIVDIEETVVRYGWVGVAGIGYAAKADDSIKYPNWEGVFDSENAPNPT